MFKILIPLLLLLAACNDNKLPHDYKFEKRQVTNTNISVELVELNSYKELKDQYLQVRKRPAPKTLVAFTVVRSTECKVYIVKPEVSFQPAYLGHEIAHCFYGHWHPNQDKSRK